MTIWWCEEHEATQNGSDLVRCWRYDWQEGTEVVLWGDCRMVQMQLSPTDPMAASYDIEIPDFVNRSSMGW